MPAFRPMMDMSALMDDSTQQSTGVSSNQDENTRESKGSDKTDSDTDPLSDEDEGSNDKKKAIPVVKDKKEAQEIFRWDIFCIYLHQASSPLTWQLRNEGFIDNNIINHWSRDNIEGKCFTVWFCTG